MLDVKLHFLALCDELTVLSHEPVDFIDVKIDGHVDVARRTKSCATPAATLGSRMRFRTSISRVSSLFFLDDQPYVCIVQTASTGFEQIAQKLNDLHMETVRDIVIVGRCLGCGVTVLLITKLFGEEHWLLKGLKACQSCRCWSFAAPPCFRRLAETPAGCIPRLTR